MRDAIEAAMFSPSGDASWTFTAWVLSSLAANGLKVEDIPDGLLPAVLDQLVMTGRAVPESKFVASTARAQRRAKFRALAKPRPEPAVETNPDA
jgi:hypothetical protein